MNRATVGGIAATDLADVLRPKEVGDFVVSHVLEVPKEPTPNFEAMRRMIAEPFQLPHQDEHDKQ